jgi:hypothetical protein
MDSKVEALPNHYKTLGVAPSATTEQIAQAFARKMSAFAARPLTAAAQIGIAFETLRDPERRRTYDASLRPAAVPQMGYSARWKGLPMPGSPLPPRPAPAEAKPAPFIVAPEPWAEVPAPQTVAVAEPVRRVVAEPRSQAEAKPQRDRELRLPNVEDRPVEWKPPAIAGGVLVAGVVLLGAFAGWDAGNGEAQQAPAGVTAALPRAKPRPVATAPSPLAESKPRGLQFRQPRSAATATAHFKRSSPVASQRPSDEFLSEAAQTPANPPGEVASSEAVTKSPAVETAAALPLPNAVVARTLDRIGYSCGKVAATSALGSGVYEVTCTSGASYQAAPVRGRYHFHRLSAR